jgi:hypothetical protein
MLRKQELFFVGEHSNVLISEKDAGPSNDNSSITSRVPGYMSPSTVLGVIDTLVGGSSDPGGLFISNPSEVLSILKEESPISKLHTVLSTSVDKVNNQRIMCNVLSIVMVAYISIVMERDDFLLDNRYAFLG